MTGLLICTLASAAAIGCFDRGGLGPIGDASVGDASPDANHDGAGGAGRAGSGGPDDGPGTGTGGVAATGGQRGTGGFAGGVGSGGRSGGTAGRSPGTGAVMGTGGAAGAGGLTAVGGGGGSGAGGATCGAVCDIFCTNGNVLDANGCPLCKCRPAPCPSLSCQTMCPYGVVLDQNGCQTCDCSPAPPPCVPADCGLPAPAAPTLECSDGSVAGPVCERDASQKCTWQSSSCPAACGSNADYMTCTANAACTWLAPGCGEPALAAAGCYSRTAVGCTSDAQCGKGHQCLKRVVDPCFNLKCALCAATEAICQ